MKILSIVGIVIFGLSSLFYSISLLMLIIDECTGAHYPQTRYFIADSTMAVVFGLGLTFSIIVLKKTRKKKAA